jgi:hypothetical protein
MTKKECTKKGKQVALEHGADLVGVVTVQDLPEHSERIERILPKAHNRQWPQPRITAIRCQ